MQAIQNRLLPQPFIGIATLGIAMTALSLTWLSATAYGSGRLEGTGELLLALMLFGAVLVAGRFPIYIRHNAKIYLSTVPLYLMAALLSPPLAATAAGLSILIRQLMTRAQTGSYLSDIATHVGRWILLALVGSALAHITLSANAPYLGLGAAALALWAGDMLTLPMVLAPISGEHPFHIARASLQEGGLIEATQYFLGMLGALVADHQAWTLSLLAVPTVLIYLVYHKEVAPDTYRILAAIADAVDLRDRYTAEHSQRVVELTRGILSQLGHHGQEAALITVAARVHDIGKIGVPDHILAKPGPLTPEERLTMEYHVELGAQLLRRYPAFARGVGMVRHHHERWDGTGYPDRLKGADIPFGARIIAVADSFDAMTSNRPYRNALSVEQAAVVLMRGRGSQWDTGIVDAFMRSIEDRLRSKEPLHFRPKTDPMTEAGQA